MLTPFHCVHHHLDTFGRVQVLGGPGHVLGGEHVTGPADLDRGPLAPGGSARTRGARTVRHAQDASSSAVKGVRWRRSTGRTDVEDVGHRALVWGYGWGEGCGAPGSRGATVWGCRASGLRHHDGGAAESFACSWAAAVPLVVRRVRPRQDDDPALARAPRSPGPARRRAGLHVLQEVGVGLVARPALEPLAHAVLNGLSAWWASPLNAHVFAARAEGARPSPAGCRRSRRTWPRWAGPRRPGRWRGPSGTFVLHARLDAPRPRWPTRSTGPGALGGALLRRRPPCRWTGFRLLFLPLLAHPLQVRRLRLALAAVG
jgi:hypothetical protein